MVFSRRFPAVRLFSILATAYCRKHRSPMSSDWWHASEICRTDTVAFGLIAGSWREHLRVDQSIPHHCGDRLDGRNALSAPPVCLSLRGREGIGTIGNAQADGAPASPCHHQPGDDRDMGAWSLACLAGARFSLRVVRVGMAAGKARAGDRTV